MEKCHLEKQINTENDKNNEIRLPGFQIVDEHFDSKNEMIYHTAFGNEKSFHEFSMYKIIGDYRYVFYFDLGKEGEGSIHFKTEEYEYASTNLNKEQGKILIDTIVSFLRSISEKFVVKRIRVIPNNAMYSVLDLKTVEKKY